LLNCFAAEFAPLFGGPLLGGPASSLELLHHRDHGLVFEVKLVDRTHLGRFFRVDNQPAALGVHIVA
jgi:hypothetical protein